jgi:hypothetical protein
MDFLSEICIPLRLVPESIRPTLLSVQRRQPGVRLVQFSLGSSFASAVGFPLWKNLLELGFLLPNYSTNLGQFLLDLCALSASLSPCAFQIVDDAFELSSRPDEIG